MKIKWKNYGRFMHDAYGKRIHIFSCVNNSRKNLKMTFKTCMKNMFKFPLVCELR